MRSIIFISLLTLLPATSSLADKKAPVTDASSAQALDRRISRLEQVLRSQGLLDLLTQVEALKLEVQRLKGEIEVQNHTIDQLKNKQTKLYADLDDRLRNLNTTGEAYVGQSSPPPLETLEPAMSNIPTTDGADEPGLKMENTVSHQENGDETVTETTPASIDPARAQADYQAAFKLLKEADYDKAVAAFEGFLEQYPDSDYADNAQYWLGEAFYVQRNYEAAATAYQNLLNTFPQSRKVAHSLLKLGYAWHEMGKIEDARTKLNEVMQRFPGTTAASLASDRLATLPESSEQS